jgi:hypothetical protein
MSPFAIVLLVIGLPLMLVAVGFVILVTKAFSGQDGRAQRVQTLEAARQLEKTLSAMETRLTALEDILLAPEAKQGGAHD